MRKAINRLSVVVEQLELDPFSGHLFVFNNRRRKILKILYWERNGFCLWQKRLEKQRFKWPKTEAEVIEVGQKGEIEGNRGNREEIGSNLYLEKAPMKTGEV